MGKAQQIFTTVSAEGTAETAFKSVDFNISIIGRGKDNAEARGKVDATYDKVKKAIAQLNRQGAGIDEKRMKCGYNVQPWNEYDRTTNEQVHKGYQVTATVHCTTEEVDAATLIMDVLTKITGSTVQSPSFTPDDSAEARQNAVQAAYDRAMEDFRMQCAVLGQNPDAYEVVSYTTGATSMHHGHDEGIRAMAASAPAAPPTEIKAGTAEISASINLTFVRKPAGASRSKPSTRATSGNGKPTVRTTSVGRD